MRIKISPAIKKLGVTREQLEEIPHVTPLVSDIMAPLARRKMPTDPYYYLNTCTDTEVRAMLKAYYSVYFKERRYMPLEVFCCVAAVDPNAILHSMVQAIARISRLRSTVELSASHPAMVKKSIETALDDLPESASERALMHRAAGFLPMPKGSQTVVQVTQNSSQNPQYLNPPSPDAMIRRLANRFQQLPEQTSPIEDADVLEEESNS